jgi:quercetin dioxygenase-like cupin family protein
LQWLGVAGKGRRVAARYPAFPGKPVGTPDDQQQFSLQEEQQMAAVTVKALESKYFDHPDEKRRPPKTQVDVVTIGDTTLARVTFEPGWRWSETVKTVVHTDSCQVNHLGVCTAGRLTVQMEDGTRATVQAGGAYAIPPGHDAWVEGDEPFVGYELMSAAIFAKPA